MNEEGTDYVVVSPHLHEQLRANVNRINASANKEIRNMGEAKRRSEAGLPPKMDQRQMVVDMELYAVDVAGRRRRILMDPQSKGAVAKAVAARYSNGLLIDPEPVLLAKGNLPAQLYVLPLNYSARAWWREAWRRLRGGIV